MDSPALVSPADSAVAYDHLEMLTRRAQQKNWRKMVDYYVAEDRRNKRSVSGAAAGSTGLTPAQANMQQRAVLLAGSVEMTQQINSQVIATPTAGNNQVNINARNVGLIKKFIVEISGTVTNTDGANASTATTYGLANILSNVILLDLNNNQRINTGGVHLALLRQVKHRATDISSAPLSTIATDAMIAGEFVASGSAPNFPVIAYPLPAKGANAPFRAVFEIPVAYSDTDLRGAIYANVLNAAVQLQLTLNPNPCQTGADTTSAVWAGGAGNISNVTVATYQVYLDQLPTGPNGVVLPILDLSTIYELKTTTLTGIAQGQDFPIPYANFREFLSTLVTFNSTQATAGLKNGSDVSYWALQSANFTNIFKIDPLLSAQITRQIIGKDLPLGTYYFSHRKKPLNTQVYGNLQLILNALSVAAVPYVNVYWEDFALANVLTQASSLPAS